MKGFFRRINPKVAILDFVDVWQEPSKHRWPVMGVAMAMTFALFMLFIPESKRIEPRPPVVIYISTWMDGRSELEIMASNCRNQALKDELEGKLEERAEIRSDIYAALGRATFIDVDAIQAEAEEERARQEAEDGPTVLNDEAMAGISVEEYCTLVLERFAEQEG